MSLKGGRRSGRRGRWEVKGTRGREELSVLAEIWGSIGFREDANCSSSGLKKL